MPEVKQVFQRTEIKYFLTNEQKSAFLDIIAPHFETDGFGRSRIYSLYLDTWDYSLIRESIEKPLYKEKLRLRSYGVPEADSTVFLELKKKYKGMVYKRREKLTLTQAESYLTGGPRPKDTQIMKEIDWAIKSRGGVKPSALIAYDREAYCCKTDGNLRITFDSNLTFRTNDLLLDGGSSGERLIGSGENIMEIKAAYAMPLWLAEALDTLAIYPSSFSKYGTVYQNYIGGTTCSKVYLSPYPCQQKPSLSPASSLAR